MVIWKKESEERKSEIVPSWFYSLSSVGTFSMKLLSLLAKKLLVIEGKNEKKGKRD